MPTIDQWRRWLNIVPRADSNARDGTPNTSPYLIDSDEQAHGFAQPSAPRRDVRLLVTPGLGATRGDTRGDPHVDIAAPDWQRGYDAAPMRIENLRIPGINGLEGLKGQAASAMHGLRRSLNLKPPYVVRNTQLASRTLTANYTEVRSNDQIMIPGVFVGARPR